MIKSNSKKNELEIQIKKNLLEKSKLSKTDLLRELNIDLKQGLTTEFVEDWQFENGYNKIKEESEYKWYICLFGCFVNPFSIFLMITSLFYYLIDDLQTSLVTLFLIVLSGIIKFFQEQRSNNACEKLKNMLVSTCNVLRDGEKKKIPISKVVDGDIVYLSAGDIIPADLRIIESNNLFVSQASLTGESEPVQKTAIQNDENQNNVLEAENIAFMGTNVVSGFGIGIILSIGSKTYLSTMAKLISKKKADSNFDKGLKNISWLLMILMFVMTTIIFLIYGFSNHSWSESFSFSLAIAIYLTPEMLPVIISSNLSKGAISMSRKKTIVKNINSIQNFGSIDILCSDKTGTLTENKVVLECHFNIEGNDDERVLRHAYLNSNFQTGLKNLLDLAIIEKGKKHDFDYLNFEYRKIDELPFDFTRRCLSVLLEDRKGKVQLITKGALEEMLNNCKWVEYNGKILELTDEYKEIAKKTALKLNKQGMRVLALAQKNEIDRDQPLTSDSEKDMVLMGILSFLDPAKESAKTAIQALKDYNIKIKVLTGDSDVITKYICKSVGVENYDKVIIGNEIENYSDEELKKIVEKYNIFAKLSPQQKLRIIKVLRSNGHTIGFMGDGINDAPAMREADVAISVDTAVDIAKESADIVLLKKDLNVLLNGVIEGRKILCNITKFLKITISANFGCMFSALIAAICLPFEMITETQVLAFDMLYDISQITVPWDNVDEEYIRNKRKWDPKSILRFMMIFGMVCPISDSTVFFLLYKVLGWNNPEDALSVSLFQTGFYTQWFVTQMIDTTCMRTMRIPIIESRPSIQIVCGMVFMLFGIIIPFTGIAKYFDLVPLPFKYFEILFLFVIYYMVIQSVAKRQIYYRIYKEWL